MEVKVGRGWKSMRRDGLDYNWTDRTVYLASCSLGGGGEDDGTKPSQTHLHRAASKAEVAARLLPPQLTHNNYADRLVMALTLMQNMLDRRSRPPASQQDSGRAGPSAYPHR